MATFIIRFLNILLAAVLAGVSLGIWIGFNPMRLSAATYLEQQQNMLGALRFLMVFLVVVATVITLVSAFLQKNKRPVFTALLIAAAFFIACILISRFGVKPIDDQIIAWTSDTLPANWTELRDKWWSLHIMRTMTEIIALCLITWVSVRRD